MELNRPLSSLELTALGIIYKRGECLAHAVVTQFTTSQTFAYRSGAGSIYPLLKRLTEAGLLKLDNRRYSLTDSGREALRNWLRPPFGPDDISTNLDEVRSRAYFLKLLTPEEREAFIQATLQGLTELLTKCLTSLEKQKASGDLFGTYAMLGAVRETEARIAWMHELKQGLLP